MKVLVVAHNYYSFGGAESVMRNLMENISKQNVDLHLLTDNVADNNIDNNFEQVYCIKNHNTIPAINAFEFLIRSFRLMRNILKEEPFDIVHIHGNIVKPPKNIPSLMTVHGTYKNELPYLLKHPISPFYKILYSSLVYSQYLYEKHTYKFVRYYHAVSTQTKKELIEMGIPADKIFQIPNGVDTNRFYPKNTKEKLLNKLNLREDTGTKIVLYVGGITPRKGIHVLIKAIPYVLKEYNAHFIFVGGTPRLAKSYVNYLNNLVNSLRIKDFVHFMGRVSDEELVDIYNACDLFVSPSYSEGCSLNILEAAACGKPVVATDVGGAKDILGDYGYYVEPDDYVGLVKWIVRALNERNFYNNEIRKRVEENFTWKKVAKEMVKLYEKCIEMG